MRGPQKVARRGIEDEAETLETFDVISTECAELEAFAEAVSGGAPYPLPVAEAVHGSALLEAIVRSASSGESVEL